ncbi:hypothetical protein HDU97_010096 [Phlyctochytrium planicorne]|nr:hypothetical protein HDU97_010096 [Phlyctochytrium planicorne]
MDQFTTDLTDRAIPILATPQHMRIAPSLHGTWDRLVQLNEYGKENLRRILKGYREGGGTDEEVGRDYRRYLGCVDVGTEVVLTRSAKGGANGGKKVVVVVAGGADQSQDAGDGGQQDIQWGIFGYYFVEWNIPRQTIGSVMRFYPFGNAETRKCVNHLLHSLLNRVLQESESASLPQPIHIWIRVQRPEQGAVNPPVVQWVEQIGFRNESEYAERWGLDVGQLEMDCRALIPPPKYADNRLYLVRFDDLLPSFRQEMV